MKQLLPQLRHLLGHLAHCGGLPRPAAAAAAPPAPAPARPALQLGQPLPHGRPVALRLVQVGAEQLVGALLGGQRLPHPSKLGVGLARLQWMWLWLLRVMRILLRVARLLLRGGVVRARSVAKVVGGVVAAAAAGRRGGGGGGLGPQLGRGHRDATDRRPRSFGRPRGRAARLPAGGGAAKVEGGRGCTVVGGRLLGAVLLRRGASIVQRADYL